MAAVFYQGAVWAPGPSPFDEAGERHPIPLVLSLSKPALSPVEGYDGALAQADPPPRQAHAHPSRASGRAVARRSALSGIPFRRPRDGIVASHDRLSTGPFVLRLSKYERTLALADPPHVQAHAHPSRASGRAVARRPALSDIPVPRASGRHRRFSRAVEHQLPFVLRLSKYERTLAQADPTLCKPMLILREPQDEWTHQRTRMATAPLTLSPLLWVLDTTSRTI